MQFAEIYIKMLELQIIPFGMYFKWELSFNKIVGDSVFRLIIIITEIEYYSDL